QQFPRALMVLGALVVALGAAWYGLLRQGAARVVGWVIAVTALAAVAILLFTDLDHLWVAVVLLVGPALSLAAASEAFRVPVPLPDTSPPSHPVLLFNPKSGGGKAERFSLASEARARGITPIELGPGADLERLVRDAVADGADGLAMAGGDGSQAI